MIGISRVLKCSCIFMLRNAHKIASGHTYTTPSKTLPDMDVQVFFFHIFASHNSLQRPRLEIVGFSRVPSYSCFRWLIKLPVDIRIQLFSKTLPNMDVLVPFSHTFASHNNSLQRPRLGLVGFSRVPAYSSFRRLIELPVTILTQPPRKPYLSWGASSVSSDTITLSKGHDWD